MLLIRMMMKQSIRTLSLYTLFIIFIGVFGALWLAWRWRPNLAQEKERPTYPIIGHHPDTLLVAFIGDSWADLHPSSQPDSMVSADWTAKYGKPVRFVSCGKGGANSGDVYRLMFRQNLPIDSFSSMPLLQQRPDYCVISAGGNDARQNVGKDFYVANYQLIIRHLLRCGIRPVVIGMPDLDLITADGGVSLKIWYKCLWLDTEPYNVPEYSQTLRKYLQDSKMMDSVIYVGCELWNQNGYHDFSLYQVDRIHLNTKGYSRLDSCLLSVIMNDVDGK